MLILDERLNEKPLLVYANKQDIITSMDAEEVMSSLELTSIIDRQWNIQGCSTVTKNGISDGMSWLIAAMTECASETQSTAGSSDS